MKARKMLIKVTAEHIKRGSPRHPCACPIARAITEALAGQVASVTGRGIQIGRVLFQHTPETRNFMNCFDELAWRHELLPFEFELHRSTSSFI